jgi:DNA-binding Xre family transcriptional regulator
MEPTQDRDAIAVAINERMIETKMTLTALGRKSGLSEVTIRKARNAQPVEPKTLMEIATTLGMPPKWLLDVGAGRTPPTPAEEEPQGRVASINDFVKKPRTGTEIIEAAYETVFGDTETEPIALMGPINVTGLTEDQIRSLSDIALGMRLSNNSRK